MEIQHEDFLPLLFWCSDFRVASEGLSLLNNFSKHSPADSVTERQAGEKAGRERIQLSNQLSAKIKKTKLKKQKT